MQQHIYIYIVAVMVPSCRRIHDSVDLDISKGLKAFASEILEGGKSDEGLGEEQEIRHNLSMDILVHKAQTKTTNKNIYKSSLLTFSAVLVATSSTSFSRLSFLSLWSSSKSERAGEFRNFWLNSSQGSPIANGGRSSCALGLGAIIVR